MLNTMGFSVRSTPLYSINRIAALPTKLADDIKSARIGAGAFYSPDEARAFVALALRAGLEAPCRRGTTSPRACRSRRARDQGSVERGQLKADPRHRSSIGGAGGVPGGIIGDGNAASPSTG